MLYTAVDTEFDVDEFFKVCGDYYVYVGEEKVPVSYDVYSVYKKEVNRNAYRFRMMKKHQVSCVDDFSAVEEFCSCDDGLGDEYDDFALRFALASLGEIERKLILAIFFYGYTESQVAEVLGVTQSTVNYRKKRALAKLREFLLD